MTALTDPDDYEPPVMGSVGHRESGAAGEIWRGQRGPLGFGIPGVKPRYRVAAPVRQSRPDDA